MCSDPHARMRTVTLLLGLLLVSAVLAVRPVRATTTTFTTNTVISNASYDGQDIIVSGCTLDATRQPQLQQPGS